MDNANSAALEASAPGSTDNRNALTDVKTLCERARQHVERGAVTTDYDADRTAILGLLNAALATELVCVLR